MKKLIKLLLVSIALIACQSLTQAQTAVCRLPDAVGMGQLTDYNNYFAGKPYICWVTWEDWTSNNYYAFNYMNPAIKGYDVVINRKDGSVAFQVKNWTYHSTWLFLYDDPERLSPYNFKGGKFYCAFPLDPGTYTGHLIVNCTDGSKMEVDPQVFEVKAAAPVPVPLPSPSTAPVSKPGKKK